MPTPVFNYLATIISVISIIIATISSYQTYRNSQTNIRHKYWLTYRGKNKQRIRKVKKKLKENPIVECNKIQNSYYPNLFSKFI